MDIKSNDATPQRPDGNRTLDSDMVHLDVPAFIAQVKGESTWKESDRNSITIFKSDTLRVVLIGLHQNAELKPHQANGVITVQAVEGSITFSTDKTSHTLTAGQMVALHEKITHSVKAVTDAFFLLTLSPAK